MNPIEDYIMKTDCKDGEVLENIFPEYTNRVHSYSMRIRYVCKNQSDRLYNEILLSRRVDKDLRNFSNVIKHWQVNYMSDNISKSNEVTYWEFMYKRYLIIKVLYFYYYHLGTMIEDDVLHTKDTNLLIDISIIITDCKIQTFEEMLLTFRRSKKRGIRWITNPAYLNELYKKFKIDRFDSGKIE